MDKFYTVKAETEIRTRLILVLPLGYPNIWFVHKDSKVATIRKTEPFTGLYYGRHYNYSNAYVVGDYLNET